MHSREELNKHEYYQLIGPLLDSLGWKGREQDIYRALPYSFKDFGIDELISTISSLGFILKFQNVHLTNETVGTLPCIFFNENRCFLIIRKVGKNFLYFDPRAGVYLERKLDESEGSFITFSKKSHYEVTVKDKSRNWFQILLKRFKKPFLVVFLTSFALSILYLISPLFVMLVYKQIAIANVQTNFALLSVGILIYTLALVFFRMIRSYTLSSITSRLSFILNQEIFKRLLYLPLKISETGTVGKQLSKFRDFYNVVDFFSGPGFVALFEIPFILIFLGVMYLIGGSIAVIPLMAIIFFIILGLYYLPVVKKFSNSHQELSTKKSEFLLETFTKVNSIKSYSLQEMWLRKFSELQKAHISSSSKSNIINSNINTLSNSVISIAALSTIGFGVTKVLDGEMGSGALLASILILWKILNPLRTLFSLSVQLHKLKTNIMQINNFMNLTQEERHKDSFVYYNTLKGKISFQQVSVRYVQSSFPSVLGVNFEIERNDLLVIYGHEGSGKTSILKLLMGLVQPQAGRVMIDDLNLKQINPIKLRDQIAYCAQYASFFNESLRTFFQLESPDASEDEIFKYLEILGIKQEILDLEDGLDTVVDETDQRKFSYSFLRKINVIKTLISDAKILIFDNLETDLSIQDRTKVSNLISTQKNKKTIIITTEEQYFFEIADKILWLDRGKTKIFGPRQITNDYISKQMQTKVGEVSHGKVP
ncbi:MAG: peptidase domain-containing ABC transporter [Bacteriovoracaceae bacterium]